jgi:hypothetical protein
MFLRSSTFNIMNRILSEVRAGVKVEGQGMVTIWPAGLWKELGWTKPRAGPMEIEWMSQPALSRAEEE